MIDNPTTAAQNAPPSAATRLALLLTFVASFGAIYQAGMIPPSVLAGLIGLVVVAQLVGHPAVLGPWVSRVPTAVIALGIVMVALYVTFNLGLVAGAAVWCAALFVLCIDWNTLARLPLPLLLTLLLVTVAITHGRLDALLPMLVLWTAALVACLVLMERDATRSGTRLKVHDPSSRERSGHPAVEIGVVAALLIILVPLLAMLVPNPPQGRPNQLGDMFSGLRQSTPYWGFDDHVDTANRGKLGDEVVMRVQAEAPDYWRGTSFDRYDGRYWSKSSSDETGYPSSGTVMVRPSIGDARGGVAFKQVFTIELEASDLIFGAYRKAEVDLAETATVDRQDGTVRTYSPLPAGSVYTVMSRRHNVSGEQLRADDPLDQPVPKEIADRYLDLPDGVPDRVRQLGDQIMAGQANTYDKVRAVEQWMRDNTEYTQDAPALPPDANSAEQHLFVDRKGDCDQIATSSTVLLRSQGIPARLATGFIPGERNPLTGDFTVRARDAHAWVEVWFPNSGWQAFDPTTAVPLAGEYQASALDDLLGLLRSLLPWLGAIGIVAVGGWLIVMSVRWLLRAGARRHAPWPDRMTERLLRAGHSRGRSRQPHETLIEYTKALSDEVVGDERIADAGRIVSGELFSRRRPSEDSRAWVETTLEEIERANPARQIRRQRRREARGERRDVRGAARRRSGQHLVPSAGTSKSTK